jgi:hypothetical protein
MSFPISNEPTQHILYEQSIKSKKRSFDDDSDGYDQYVFFDEPVNKKVVMVWTEQENVILVQILSDFFSNDTMISMKTNNKWEDFTSRVNAETGRVRTRKKIYDKITNMLIRENNLHTPFKELLEKPKINKKAKRQKIVTNPTTIPLPSETQISSSNSISSLSTGNQQISSSAVPLSPPPANQNSIEYRLFLLSLSFSNGYIEGMKKYIEEKEKTPPSPLNTNLLRFNKLDNYKLEPPHQFFHLGYNCVINRLSEADFKNIHFHTLYPPHLTNPFKIGLSCHLQSEKGVKDRIHNEIQSSIDKGLDPNTPISMPFTNIDKEFQDPIDLLFYKLLSNNYIHKFNEIRKIEQFNKTWTEITSTSNNPFADDSHNLDFPSTVWDLNQLNDSY